MKAKLCLLVAIFLAGCGLFGSPTSTVKKFIASAEKGDVDTMTSLFSRKAIQKLGIETIRSSNQGFAKGAKSGSGGGYRMENVDETSTPEGRRVSFLYKDAAGTDSIKLVFDLSREGSAWKIDKIDADVGEIINSDDLKVQSEPTPVQEPPPPPPPLSEKGATERKVETKGKTISGGVLNGKAISLPQPAYPPIGRAVKASGTVVVQVLVDENGNVVSATAVSGHPLLLAGCIAAARGAKFPPAKLSGQPVKVSGTIIYKFDAPQ